MTPQTAHAFALMLACQARIAGMQAANQQRLMLGLSTAYDEEAFFAEAYALENIADGVIQQ